MKWKDSEDPEKSRNEPIEDYLDDEVYSPWKKRSPGRFIERLLGKSTGLFILAAVVVFIVLILAGGMFSGSGGKSYDGRIAKLEEQIRQLETSQGKPEEIAETVARVNELDKKMEQLKGRFDRMEAALSLRMDHIAKKMSTLDEKQVVAPKPAPKPVVKEKVPEVVKKPVETVVTEKVTRYHVVIKGDTLYSISRNNGLTVDQLLKMNDLKPNQTIKPGQRLRISQ